MPMLPQILDSRLLKSDALKQPIKVFLCGPGVGDKSFNTRSLIRQHLEKSCKTSVMLGEDLISGYSPKNVRAYDLQTLESRFALEVDFTVLMLHSPGSIAELGTFSMVPNIRSRLYVIVSNEFYNAESYIARGPLSLIANFSKQNIIYANFSKIDNVLHKLDFPVMQFKYIKSLDSSGFSEAKKASIESENSHSNELAEHILPMRKRFQQAMVLATIHCLPDPRYPDVLKWTGIPQDELKPALKVLFDEARIQKTRRKCYQLVNGLHDDLLSPFSSIALSRLRARLIGTH